MHVFEHASRTTQGAREYQEDLSVVWPGTDDPSLPAAPGGGEMDGKLVAVLADGMGGHTGGALASRMVCEGFINCIARQDGTIAEGLRDALIEANGAVAKKVASDPVLSGMGSTVIGAFFSPDGLEWVSVGDSPLLLYRRGEVALLNEDHSLAPELDRLAASGRITQEQARRDPRRHMLRSAVTGEDLDLVDQSRKPLQLEPGDYVILASDGVQTLEPSEIERIVAAYADDGADAVASALIRAVEALRDPHQDNATVVVVRALPQP